VLKQVVSAWFQDEALIEKLRAGIFEFHSCSYETIKCLEY